MNRRTRISESWELSDGLKIWLEGKKVLLPEDEVERFVDHHMAAGSLMASWDAAFRTWVRNGIKYGSIRVKTEVVVQEEPEFIPIPDSFKVMMKKLTSKMTM